MYGSHLFPPKWNAHDRQRNWEERRRPQLVEAEKKMKMWPTIQFYQIDDQRFNHIKKTSGLFLDKNNGEI
jgi:hypothetical protein